MLQAGAMHIVHDVGMSRMKHKKNGDAKNGNAKNGNAKNGNKKAD